MQRIRSGRNIGLAFGLLALLTGCDDGPAQPQAVQAEPPAVDVAHAKRQAVVEQFEFVGRVQAIERVELRARIEGFLQERDFREGQFVEAGSRMFRIEPDIFQARLELARAHLAAAEALQVEADANLERSLQLVSRGNISQQSVDEAEAASRTTAADVLARTAEQRQAEIDLSYTEIMTPISGRVGREALSVGNLVSPNSGVLATVTSLDPISVVFSVSEADLINVQRQRAEEGKTGDLRDQEADVVPRIVLPNGDLYDHDGTIDFVGAEVDPLTGTVPIRATFANPDVLLLHGQFASVVLTTQQPENKIVIPVSAVQEDQAGAYVLVLGDDKLALIRRIERGRTQETNLIVEQGLEEGEIVIVEGLQKIRPGVPVTPVFRDGGVAGAQ